jgi:hypothetical protein
MGQALQITRTDHTGAALRALAGKCRDGAQVRRLLAMAMVLDGRPRSVAASSNGRVAPGRAGGRGRRNRRAKWIGRPCAIGCIATTMRAWMV